MERLTKRRENGNAYVTDDYCFDTWANSFEGQAIDRLAYYEDLEEQGRLVVLPCKVGDTVYKLCPVSTFLNKGDMWSGRIIESDCDMCSWGCCDCHDIGPQYDDSHKNIVHEMTLGLLSAIVRIIPYWGKFYFLTREQEEQALKEGAN